MNLAGKKLALPPFKSKHEQCTRKKCEGSINRPLAIFNDPSAGSPTETLLRLLLPLNNLVCHSSLPDLSVATWI